MGEWSADLPTKDGWYWAYEDYGNHFAIDFIRVEFSGRPDGEPLILSVEHDRQSDFELWDAWYGPVNPPDMSLSILSEIGHISEDCEPIEKIKLEEIRELSDRSIRGQYDYGEMIEAMSKVLEIAKLGLK